MSLLGFPAGLSVEAAGAGVAFSSAGATAVEGRGVENAAGGKRGRGGASASLFFNMLLTMLEILSILRSRRLSGLLLEGVLVLLGTDRGAVVELEDGPSLPGGA